MKRYLNQKVVIIGGTSGIGLATAKKLLAEGARVLVTGRSQASLEATRQALGKAGTAAGEAVEVRQRAGVARNSDAEFLSLSPSQSVDSKQ